MQPRLNVLVALAAALAAMALAAAAPAAAQAKAAGRAGAALPARTAEQVILISPLPFGVDAYLIMTRQGTLSGARAVGAKVRIFESSDPETRSENIRAAINYGATIIVAPGPEFIDIVSDFAEDFPDIRFLMVEDCPAKLAPNVFCVQLRTYEAGFLAGVEAGLTTRSGKVGTIAPVDYPESHRFTDTFADGARYARPGVSVHPTLWIGGDNPWSDPLRAQSQAAVMLSDGVDRIFATVSAGNGGVYKVVANSPGDSRHRPRRQRMPRFSGPHPRQRRPARGSGDRARHRRHRFADAAEHGFLWRQGWRRQSDRVGGACGGQSMRHRPRHGGHGGGRRRSQQDRRGTAGDPGSHGHHPLSR